MLIYSLVWGELQLLLVRVVVSSGYIVALILTKEQMFLGVFYSQLVCVTASMPLTQS
jgi:hypothetical protein